LDPKSTKRTRKDYIETSYIKGVRGANGEMAIRPLNEEEREWLSQFIAETDHCNFKKTNELRDEEKVLKRLRMDYTEAKRRVDLDEMEMLFKKIQTQYNKVKSLRLETNAFYVEDEERQELFNRDYERRMDVYNNAKITENLVLFDLNEYDKFTTEAINDVNPENLILKQLERTSERKFRRRKKKTTV
jgi:hypothetical protein